MVFREIQVTINFIRKNCHIVFSEHFHQWSLLYRVSVGLSGLTLPDLASLAEYWLSLSLITDCMEAFLQLWPYSVVRTIGLWPVWQACGRKVIHVGYRTKISPLYANNKNYQNKQYHLLRRQRNVQLSKFFGGYLLVFMILVSVIFSIKKVYGNQVINPSRLA